MAEYPGAIVALPLLIRTLGANREIIPKEGIVISEPGFKTLNGIRNKEKPGFNMADMHVINFKRIPRERVLNQLVRHGADIR